MGVLMQAQVQKLTLKVAKKETADKSCPVLVMTCKRTMLTMRNILKQVKVERMMVSLDGTFKFDCGKGVLLTFGVVIMVTKNSKAVRRLYNWLYVWTQTENTAAGKIGVSWLKKAPEVFFGLSAFKWGVHCIDHSWPFHNSLSNNSGAITVTCMRHVLDNLKRRKLGDKRDLVRSDVKLMHACAITDRMMGLISGLMTEAWTEDMGLVTFASSWRQHYGIAPFFRFYHCASGKPGLKPNQNITEGTNNALKVLVQELYQAVSGFINDSMVTISAQCPGVSEADVSIKCTDISRTTRVMIK